MADTGMVLVGVDGSPESRAALEYAWAEAGRRHARLRVVAGFRPPEYYAPAYGWGNYAMIAMPTREEIAADVRGEVERMLDEVRQARTDLAATGVPVEVAVRPGHPGDLLVEESAKADVLVVGHRGRGAVASTVLGSVGLACVLHAACPVTVVRPAPGAASHEVPEATAAHA
ncbi:universal stress protein [Pseudonocardia sp. GCM10023141]|uniref:universal stress protein n=1 Tax=Pseudonocardia sp. GCM10023141 TaxID=3252653 RepID=UPI00360E1958